MINGPARTFLLPKYGPLFGAGYTNENSLPRHSKPCEHSGSAGGGQLSNAQPAPQTPLGRVDDRERELPPRRAAGKGSSENRPKHRLGIDPVRRLVQKMTVFGRHRDVGHDVEMRGKHG